MDQSTEQKLRQLENRIRELELEIDQSRIYRHFFQYSRDLVCIANNEGRFLKLSPSFTEALGYSMDELLNSQFTDFIHPDDLQSTLNEIALNQSGASTLRFENRYIKKSGEIITLQWVSTTDVKNNLIYAVARDVSEIRRTEAELRKNQQLLSASQAMAKMGSWSYSIDNGDLYWSDELYNIFEIRTEERNDLYNAYLKRFDEEGLLLLDQHVHAAIGEVKSYDFKHSVNLEGKETKYVHCIGIPQVDKFGRVVRIDGIVQDITEQTVKERIISKSVREKEILIQELHHRVKNNLQVINSLLSLQSNLSNDEQLKSIFNDSQERIRSMATIHDLLYHNEDVSMIDFSQYINRIAEEILRSRKGESHQIDMKIDVPTVHYNIDIAVPLGLIFTEIMTNALKHAFDPQDKGMIEINLRRIDEKHSQLSFNDNGKGFDPKSIDRSASLGMLIMENLTEQLDGKIEILSDTNGTIYHLSFKH